MMAVTNNFSRVTIKSIRLKRMKEKIGWLVVGIKADCLTRGLGL